MILRRLSFLTLVALVLMPCVPRASQAAQSYANCTGFITSLPTVIATQGVWCLNQDVNTAIASGNAITINTDNVTIDCNGFKLDGLAAGLGTSANGIFADGRINATVRHCDIRGFEYGLKIINSQPSPNGGHKVEDNRFDGNTNTALEVDGDGSVIRHNRISNSGGSTIVANAAGIAAVYSVDILDNTVSGVVARSGGNGFSFGIVTLLNRHGSINGNRVRGLLKDGTGKSYGIANDTSDRLTLRDNDLIGDGSASSTGISCYSVNGRAKDNVVSGFAVGLSVCSDAGGNDVTP